MPCERLPAFGSADLIFSIAAVMAEEASFFSFSKESRAESGSPCRAPAVPSFSRSCQEASSSSQQRRKVSSLVVPAARTFCNRAVASWYFCSLANLTAGAT